MKLNVYELTIIAIAGIFIEVCLFVGIFLMLMSLKKMLKNEKDDRVEFEKRIKSDIDAGIKAINDLKQ